MLQGPIVLCPSNQHMGGLLSGYLALWNSPSEIGFWVTPGLLFSRSHRHGARPWQPPCHTSSLWYPNLFTLVTSCGWDPSRSAAQEVQDLQLLSQQWGWAGSVLQPSLKLSLLASPRYIRLGLHCAVWGTH